MGQYLPFWQNLRMILPISTFAYHGLIRMPPCTRILFPLYNISSLSGSFRDRVFPKNSSFFHFATLHNFASPFLCNFPIKKGHAMPLSLCSNDACPCIAGIPYAIFCRSHIDMRLIVISRLPCKCHGRTVTRRIGRNHIRTRGFVERFYW